MLLLPPMLSSILYCVMTFCLITKLFLFFEDIVSHSQHFHSIINIFFRIFYFLNSLISSGVLLLPTPASHCLEHWNLISLEIGLLLKYYCVHSCIMPPNFLLSLSLYCYHNNFLKLSKPSVSRLISFPPTYTFFLLLSNYLFS